MYDRVEEHETTIAAVKGVDCVTCGQHLAQGMRVISEHCHWTVGSRSSVSFYYRHVGCPLRMTPRPA